LTEDTKQVVELCDRLFNAIDGFHDDSDENLTVSIVLDALLTTMIMAASRSPGFDAEQFRAGLMTSLQSLTFVDEAPHGHA
jgi:hypothetical protein